MWHLNFFGGLRASRQERTIERFRTQKTAALLALLALRGARSREDVCALLWPDASPEAARNSLSAALSALRRDLGDNVVCADRISVALASSAFETDVSLFDEALKAGEVTRAVELYRGHLLPGFYEDPFPSLEREYQEKAHTVFKARLEELEDNGESAVALELARRAASLFGDEERWFLGFMRAHYGLGELDAALRAYDALGRFMRKNGDTSSETARLLAKAIRRDKEVEASTPTPPVARRTSEPARSEIAPAAPMDTSSPTDDVPTPQTFHNNLPTQWTRFFGRETERITLTQWLESGQKLVTLSGAGGSGKTRLSLETLRGLASRWEGDVVFVPLASIEDAEVILPAIRDALGLTGTPDLSPLEQVERALRGRRVLLFLDNFEQLVEGGAPRLQALRERLPQATFLVTSRVLLQLPGEREFPVSPLPTPLRNTAPAEVRDCASAALFCDRAGLVLDDNNAESVGALCRRLDGIPLALELAAARAKVMSPTQILERLQKHPDFLQSRELGIPARHKTLRATIEWSTDLLPPDLRSFWTRLSLFHGGWTLDAAERVASPGICEDWETLDWLTLLRECSLLFVEDREGEPRFRMLQTLREFGREQLQDPSEIEHAFFDFYLDLAQKAASAMQGPGQTAWLARLDAEQDNLRAALTYARDAEPERGLLLATALIDFWETRLSLDEGRGWIETFLRATAPEKTATPAPVQAPVAPSLPPDTRVRALSGAGRMASHSLDMNESRALVEQGLQVAQQSGDTTSFIYAASAFVRFAMTTGDAETDLVRGRELAEQSLRLARQSNDRALLGEALLSIVYLRMAANDLGGLRTLNLEAIAVTRELKDEANLSRLLSNLAHIDYFEKNWDEANELLDESTEIARRLTSPWPMMEALWTRSNVAREEGRLGVARATITEEWELCRDNPSLLWAYVLSVPVIGYLRLREGDPVGAVRLWGAAEKLRESAGFQMAPVLRGDFARHCDEARTLLGEARFAALLKEGRGLSAQQAVDAVLLPSKESDSEELTAARARALSGAGRMAWYGGDLQDAQSKIRQGLDAARQAGDPSVLINATRSSALASTAYGDALQARDLGLEGVRLARESGDSGLLLKALMDSGFAEINVSDFAASEAVCLEAIALARREGNERALAMIMATLAIAYNYLHRYDEANVLIAESEFISRRLGAIYELMVAMSLRGHIASILNHHDEARAIFREVLPLARDTIGNSWTLINMLLSVAYSFARRGDARGCARILGACESLAQSINYQLMPFLFPDYEYFRDGSRRTLGEEEFLREWRVGQLLSFDQTISFILEQNEVPPSESPDLATRARALSGAGRMAWHDGDFAASRELVNQGLDASRKAGDISSFADAVGSFVRLTTASDDLEEDAAEGRRMAEEAVRLSRAAGDKSLLAESLISLAFATMIAGQMMGMRSVLGEARDISRELGDDIQLATAITSLSTVAYFEEQFDEALELVSQSTEIARRVDSPFHLYSALLCAANASREQGDLKASVPPTTEILQMSLGNVPRSSLPYAVFCASYLLARLGDIPSSVQLLGAAQTLGEQIGYKMLPSYRLDFERYHVLAHEILGESDFEDCWRKGAKLTMPQAISFALARLEENSPETPDPNVATRIRELRTVFKSSGSETSVVATESSNELRAARARALSGAGRLAWYASDMEEANALLEQGLSASQEIGDAEGIVYATRGLMRTAAAVGDSGKSRQVAREALSLARASGDKSLLIKALLDQAYADVNVAELASASALSSEATVLARQVGDEAALSLALNIGAIALSYQNQDKESLSLLEQSEKIARRIGSAWDLLVVLSCKGHSLSRIGEDESAQEAVNECLTLCRESFSESWTVANCLVAASYVLMRRGEILDGTQVMGGAEAMRERIGYQWMPVMMPDHDKFVALGREVLGEAEFEAALRRGSNMTPDEVFNFAIRPVSTSLSPFSHLSEESLATRSRALSGAGRLAWLGSDFEASRAHVYQGLESARESGDLTSFVTAVAAFVRFAMVTGDMDGIMAQSHLLAEEAVERSRRASDKALLLESLTALAYTHTVVSRFKEAQLTNEEAIALARELGDETRLVRSLNNQAAVFFYQGHHAAARAIVEESVPRCRYLSATWELTAALWTYSAVLREQGDLVLADQFITEAMALCRSNPTFRWGMFTVMTTMSYLFVKRGAVANGVRLMGASEALRQTFGYAIVPVLRPELERFKAEALTSLGQTAFDQAWKEGRVMTTADAMELALLRDETTFLRHAAPASGPTMGSWSSARSDEIQAARSRALSGAGRLAWHDSDFEASRTLVYEGLETARASGDVASFVHAVAAFVRFALVSDDVDGVLTPARELSEEAVARSRREGDKALLLNSLTSLGCATTTIGLLDESHAANEESIPLARELGDDVGLARVLAIQAAVYYYRGLPAPARILADENVSVSRRLNSDWDLIAALYTLSGVLRLQGQLEESDEAISETLSLCRSNPSYRWNVAHVLLMASYLFVECGDSCHAVCLLAASGAISESLGYHPTYCLRIDYEHYKAKAYEQLGKPVFDAAWEEGRVMTAEAAIELALRRDETTFTHGSTDSLADEVLAARSRALSGAGRLAVQGSDLEASRALVNQGLKAARESGDTASFVYAVAAFVRFAMVTGDVKGAINQSRLLAEEAVARSRRENAPALLLESLVALGYATCIISKFKEAYAANEEAIALAREVGDETNLVRALNSQVYVYYHQGIYPPARVILEESLELSRRIKSTNDLISTLWALSGTAREQGELALAGTAVAEFLEICHANPAFRWGLSHALQSVSYLLVKRGDPANAVRLLAASQTINDTLGYHPMPVLMVDYERYKVEAQEQLGEEGFQRAWEEGRVLSVEAAIALANRLLSSWVLPSVPSVSSSFSEEVLAARSRALSGAGRLAWQGSDIENSRALVHEGLEAARKSGDVASFVYAVAAFVRFAMVTGDVNGFIAQSRLLSEEAVDRSRREGNKALLLDSLVSLGYANSIVSQFREAYVANDEAIAIARELGDETSLVRALNNQAMVYYHEGMYAPARLILEESNGVCRRLNSVWDIIAAQWTLSSVAREQGDLDLADRAICEVLEICRSNPSFRWGVSNVLMTVSYLFVERDDARTAVRLISASEAIGAALGYHPVPVLLIDHERYKARALEMLAESVFHESWEEGRILTIEAAIELAIRR